MQHSKHLDPVWTPSVTLFHSPSFLMAFAKALKNQTWCYKIALDQDRNKYLQLPLNQLVEGSNPSRPTNQAKTPIACDRRLALCA